MYMHRINMSFQITTLRKICITAFTVIWKLHCMLWDNVCFQIKVVVVFLLGTLLKVLTGIQRCQRFPFVRSQFELGWRRSLKHGEKRVPKYSSFAQYRNQHRRPISAKEEENVISSPHTKWASIVITIHLWCFHFIIVSSAFIVWCEIKTWPFHTKC